MNPQITDTGEDIPYTIHSISWVGVKSKASSSPSTGLLILEKIVLMSTIHIPSTV